MFTLITQYWRESNWAKRLLLAVCLSYMALYPIYTNYYDGLAVEHYNRHQDFIAGKSIFFNPWQYRILSPYLVEGMHWVYMHTVDVVAPLERFVQVRPIGNMDTKHGVTQQLLEMSQNPDFLKYTLVFVAFRFLQNIAIFLLAFCYLKQFVRNDWLIFFGLVFISLALGNSVNDSDLSFNTYTDVIVYLLAGWVIVKQKSAWWIVPITVVGALNRETSLMIPYLYFLSKVAFDRFSWQHPFSALPSRKDILVTALSFALFVGVFVAIRAYYGYVEQTEWRVPRGWQMVRLNLMSSVSIKSYFEMFGTFAVLPFVFLFYFKRIPLVLQVFFVALVPIWFAVHWWAVVAYQSRLYLVPTLLIFLPGFLYIIDRAGPPAGRNQDAKKYRVPAVDYTNS